MTQAAGAVGVRWRVDLHHGGRWTSWQAAGREWLWRNPRLPAPLRSRVRPGDAFVDAGGAEECWPTVRGRPDHGDVWSRAWTGTPADASVQIPGAGRLRRRITDGTPTQVDYRVEAAPGTPFLHAVHALLAVSEEAVLDVPDAETMIVLDEPGPVRRWPSGLDRLGPEDQTAVCVLVPGVRRAVISDRDDRLELAWDCPQRPELCSLLLWRNLGGWPPAAPYRSIGIEPMVGRAAELATADPGSCAVVGPAGVFDWSLALRATSP